MLLVFVDICDENDDGFIDVDEFTRTLKLFFFSKNDSRILPTISKIELILVNEFINMSYIEHKQVPKHLFLKFVVNNQNMQKIFKKNLENINEMAINVEEEITNACYVNLKKSKYK